MSIVRVGTTKKYAEGWEAIFGKAKKGIAKKAASAASRSSKRSRGRKKR